MGSASPSSIDPAYGLSYAVHNALHIEESRMGCVVPACWSMGYMNHTDMMHAYLRHTVGARQYKTWLCHELIRRLILGR